MYLVSCTKPATPVIHRVAIHHAHKAIHHVGHARYLGVKMILAAATVIVPMTISVVCKMTGGLVILPPASAASVTRSLDSEIWDIVNRAPNDVNMQSANGVADSGNIAFPVEIVVPVDHGGDSKTSSVDEP